MNKINEIKNQYRQICDIIIKKEFLDMKDLNVIEEIISKDNTEPEFVLTYLKLVQKFKKEEFLNQIEKYKYYLSKEIISKEFSKFYEKKLSSSDLFTMLWKKIINYPNLKTFNEKMSFYNDLVNIDSSYDNIKGFVDHKKNKELTIFILVQNIKKGIFKYVKEIKNYFVKENDPNLKFKKEIEIYKKVEDYISNRTIEKPTNEDMEIHKKIKQQLNKNYNNINAIELIEQLREQIILESKINSQSFSNYFKNFSEFLWHIKGNFNKKFKDIENLENNDFELFMDFCFFIAHYDFEKIPFYIYKWDNTFSQPKEYIEKILEKNSIANVNKYKLENNNLILEVYKHLEKKIEILEIKNIDKYSIDCIINYFTKEYTKNINNELKDIDMSDYAIEKTIINDYEIEKYLKSDIQDIYINKMWDILEKHLIKIFTSKTIKSAYKKICEKLNIENYYDFLNEKDIQIFLKRPKIFEFETDFLGFTEQLFLINYIFYKGIIKYDLKDIYKLLDICMYQVAQEDGILGKYNFMMQNYFSEKKNSFINLYEKNLNIQELDEFIEILLYGRRINQLNYNEILFLLDEENYDVELEEFNNNFLKCKLNHYKISKSLSIFLESLCFNPNDKYNDLGPLTVNQNLVSNISSNNNFIFYLGRNDHHDYLHPPKVSESVQNILDEMYTKLYEQFKSNIK